MYIQCVYVVIGGLGMVSEKNLMKRLLSKCSLIYLTHEGTLTSNGVKNEIKLFDWMMQLAIVE